MVENLDGAYVRYDDMVRLLGAVQAERQRAPAPRERTIASRILATVAEFRRKGTLDTSLCWPAEELERLAMFAIAAKNDLARSAHRGAPEPDAIPRWHEVDQGGEVFGWKVADSDRGINIVIPADRRIEPYAAKWLADAVGGIEPAPAPEPPQEILQIRDAIVSTQRALRSLVRVGGNGVRIVKSADVKVAKRDAEDRLAYVLEILERVEAGVRVSERPAPEPEPIVTPEIRERIDRRLGYVLAMAVLQSNAWPSADEELRDAVELFTARGPQTESTEP